MKRILRERKHLVITSLIVISVVLVGWWYYWQAPYRTLRKFLHALEVGDVETLYALIPPHERKHANITPELMEKTYKHFLKPLLSEYRLVRIRRTSPRSLIPELIIRDIEVPFWLWFKNSKGETLFTMAQVMRYPGDKGWKIPFSLFVLKLAIAAYGRGQAEETLLRLGYDLIADARGTVFSLRRNLILLRQGQIKIRQ
jgi:hypothetical protein